MPKQYDVNSKAAAEQFKKDSRKYTKKMTKTKQIARQCLIDIGIYTKTGKLTKNYR